MLLNKSQIFKVLASLALPFGLGAITGIVMEFGTNSADYSRYAGDIFGGAPAAEGVFAFALESTFLGVLL